MAVHRNISPFDYGIDRMPWMHALSHVAGLHHRPVFAVLPSLQIVDPLEAGRGPERSGESGRIRGWDACPEVSLNQVCPDLAAVFSYWTRYCYSETIGPNKEGACCLFCPWKGVNTKSDITVNVVRHAAVGITGRDEPPPGLRQLHRRLHTRMQAILQVCS
jgi:hypothetical protein